MKRTCPSTLVPILAWVLLLGQPLWTALAQDDQSADATAAPQTQTAPANDAEHAAEGPEDADAPVDVDGPAARQVGWLELSGPLPDQPHPMAWAHQSPKNSLRGVIAQLHTVAHDDQYAGVVLFLDQPVLGLSQIAEIDDALGQVRAAGKTVLAFSEQYDLKTYLLATSADSILLLPKGRVELSGLAVEEMYFAGLLGKIGLKADFVQVGKYKGAAEPITNQAPSPEWDQNINALLDDLYEQIVQRIANARGLDRAEVEAAMRDSWVLTDQEYVERGLVDRVVDRDLVEVTGELFGDQFVWDQDMGQRTAAMNVENPFVLLRMLLKGPQQPVRRASIALVRASGPIHSGRASQASGPGAGLPGAGLPGAAPRAGLFGSESIGSRTLIEALREARTNDLIEGVVLRIDSPGGSAVASEIIWQSVRECGEVKPVFISIGPMAASGGYYIASAGQKIYCAAPSIVGSIGVVGGKITFGDLYEKLGISIRRRGRGPLSDMFNSVEPFSEQQRSVLRTAMVRVYDQFTDRVQKGRGQKIAQVEDIAEGRLFTGRQAVLNGMVDELGGVEVAIADLAEQLGLDPGTYDIINLPEPKSFAEVLEDMFGGFGMRMRSPFADAAVLGAGRALLGEPTWGSAQAVLGGLLLLREEPVLTLLPVVMRIR